MIDDDPFALPAESRVAARVDVLQRGRYMLPQRDGSKKPRGYQRVSNLVSAISDQFGLRMWEIEQTFRGVAASHQIYQELRDAIPAWDRMDKADRKHAVENLMERAKTAAEADLGARFGNHRHAVVEGYHAGLPLGVQNSGTRRHLSLYAAALVRNQLQALPDMQERRILVESLEVVGTLDNVVLDVLTGRLHIADLKTQRKFWTWLEISAQLACYAHGDAMWDNATGTWVDMPKVDLEKAMVLWMPRVPPCVYGCTGDCDHPAGEPIVDVYEVDVERGWETAQLCYKVVKDRAQAKNATAPRGTLRVAARITDEERYAALFAGCDSVAEGQALVKEAKGLGLWGPVLGDAAKAAHQRLTSTKN
jgi:hypothetical protein